MESVSDESSTYPNVPEQAMEAVLKMLELWGPDPLTAKATAAEAEFARFFARAVVLGIQRGSCGEHRCHGVIAAVKSEVRAAFPPIERDAKQDPSSPVDSLADCLETHSYEEIAAQARERHRDWVARRLDPMKRERMIRDGVLLALLRELLEATAGDFVPIQDPPPGTRF